MEEKNETDQPRRYTWPWIVLGGVVFWVVLIIIWMSVLVHRTREQRDNMPWPMPNQTISKTNLAPIFTNAIAH